MFLFFSFSKALVPKPPYVSGKDIGNMAITKIGCNYSYGCKGPQLFDSSGLVVWAHNQFGLDIPRNTSGQSVGGREGDGSIGDVVCFGNPIYHVGISLGDGICVHSTSKGKYKVILEEEKNVSKYISYRRYFDEAPPETADSQSGAESLLNDGNFLKGFIAGTFISVFIIIIVTVICVLKKSKQKEDKSQINQSINI